MMLAEAGLPSGGGAGYELFDKANALSATNFMQNLNYLRATEGELARTIRSLDQVQSARVHLVMPQREVFTRDQREPSARSEEHTSELQSLMSISYAVFRSTKKQNLQE